VVGTSSPSGPDSPRNIVRIAAWLCAETPLQPGKVNDFREFSTSLVWSPVNEDGSAEPSATARKVVPGPSWPSARSSQPVLTVFEPRSRYCWAWKWLRVLPEVDTAGTKASSPDVQNGISGFSAEFSAQPPVKAVSLASTGTRLARTVRR